MNFHQSILTFLFLFWNLYKSHQHKSYHLASFHSPYRVLDFLSTLLCMYNHVFQSIRHIHELCPDGKLQCKRYHWDMLMCPLHDINHSSIGLHILIHQNFSIIQSRAVPALSNLRYKHYHLLELVRLHLEQLAAYHLKKKIENDNLHYQFLP